VSIFNFHTRAATKGGKAKRDLLSSSPSLTEASAEVEKRFTSLILRKLVKRFISLTNDEEYS